MISIHNSFGETKYAYIIIPFIMIDELTSP